MPDREAGELRPVTVTLQAALARLQDKWGFLILALLLGGPHRFNEMIDAMPGLAPNVLVAATATTRGRRADPAAVYQLRPPRLEYSLTDDGRALEAAIDALVEWSLDGSSRGSTRHVVCGNAVETRTWCPSCEQIVLAVELEELRFA